MASLIIRSIRAKSGNSAWGMGNREILPALADWRAATFLPTTLFAAGAGEDGRNPSLRALFLLLLLRLPSEAGVGFHFLPDCLDDCPSSWRYSGETANTIS
jgi:hypothetical protein